MQPPAAYHTLYPPSANANANAEPAGTRATTTALPKKKESLITRYGLEERVKQEENIKLEEVGGKAVWEDDAQKREASLKERKAQMILAARQYVTLPFFRCMQLIIILFLTSIGG